MKSFLPLIRKQTALPALVMFLLLAISGLASSQPVQEDPTKPYKLNSNMTLFLVGVVSLFAFVAYLIINFHLCDDSDIPWVGVRRETNPTITPSLDASAFLTLAYSEVKTQKIGNGVLECVICLNKFEDDETLCVLPQCDHVFHPHCISAWLKGHVTCPICRTNLTEQQQPVEPIEPEVITERDLESQ